MTRPAGLYLDVDHDEYHGDDALSSTWVKLLTPPSCPALFKYERDHWADRKVTAALDFGQAYHTLAFGAGPEIAVVDAASWQGKAAQEERDAIRTNGQVPVLAGDHVTLRAMVAVLRDDPIFKALTADGQPEASFWWTDLYGIECRGRVDFLPKRGKGRLIIPDLKSARTANPHDFARTACVDYGYAQSADWYLRGLRAVDEADDSTAFIFLPQEKTPPYLVQPVQLNADSMRAGEVLNDRALETYAKCLETDTWPGYAPGVALAGMPGWYVNPILESE